ncbi:hypothetical protein NTHI1209_00649 [Haemophilus influenzae]|uniref:Uncharacterized protein n=1 Tax=Haemophilus influenzae TaxID=727 RepID=A0A158SW02_HAEIF|nr:hypothetical protein NTHI1209_00649 [Haemophilus influenzae]
MDYFLNVSVDGISHLEVALINVVRFALSVFERASFYVINLIFPSAKFKTYSN